MPRPNLPKIHLLRSILQTLESLRDLYLKTFKEKSTHLNHLQLMKAGKDLGVLTLDQPILQLVSGLQWTRTKTGSYLMNITKHDKQLTITQVLLTLNQQVNLSSQAMVIRLASNGYKNLPKEESISHKPIKKLEHNSTVGLDSELRRYLRNLRSHPDISLKIEQKMKKDCQHFLSLIHAYKPSKNLKPTAGKKKALLKLKT